MELTHDSVSIILPVYNKEKYISRCIKSLCSQSYDNFEVIIVNDGSYDTSAQIIKRLIEKDSRFHYFEQENSGVSSARNTGIAKAHGKWITFIDADDYIEPSYLSDIMEIVASVKADLFLWGIQYNFPDGSAQIVTPSLNGMYQRAEFLKAMVADQYHRNIGLYGYAPNKLIRKDMIDKHNIRFSTELRLMEDYDFYLSYYALIDNAYIFQNHGYHYIKDTTNSSIVSVTDVNYMSLIDIQLKCMEILHSNGSLTSNNYNIIQNNSRLLASAGILELSNPSINNLKKMRTGLSERGINIASLHRNRPLLNLFLHGKYLALASLYLMLWRKYISIRNTLTK